MAATLTTNQLAALLRRAGRQHCIDTEAARLHTILREEYLHQLPLVEDAFGRQALALLRALDTACANADDLAAATIEHFDQHPDAEIITSLPGLGTLTGARVLAEIGDDRSRFTNARSLKAYAGSAPAWAQTVSATPLDLGRGLVSWPCASGTPLACPQSSM